MTDAQKNIARTMRDQGYRLSAQALKFAIDGARKTGDQKQLERRADAIDQLRSEGYPDEKIAAVFGPLTT